MLGLVSGIAVAALTTVVENSRLAFGPYAFYGNGALIVPALGAGLALYGLWTWLLGQGRHRRELLWSTIGLHLGLGSTGLLSGGLSPASFVFTGLLFVVPAALAAFAVVTLMERLQATAARGARTDALLLTAIVVVGMFLSVAPFPPLGVGLITGAFITVGRRAGSNGALGLGVLLLIVLLGAGLAAPLLVMR